MKNPFLTYGYRGLEKSLAFLGIALLLTACGGQSASRFESSFNPRDTVLVPEYLTGEDSIAYIEDVLVQSPISASDLLNLSEVHKVESYLSYYNDSEQDSKHANRNLVTHRDSATLRLVNRIMRMRELVVQNGNARDELQWAVAVNAAIDTFRRAVPSVPVDSVFNEIPRIVEKFTAWSNFEINYHSHVYSTVAYYRVIESYRKLIAAVPTDLRTLVLEEYEAWHDLNEARFSFWWDVAYTQSWYALKPLEYNEYQEILSDNRRLELDLEREIILDGEPYYQKGTTVTTEQWEKWITKHSVPEDIDFLRKMDEEERIPSDSLVTDRVTTLKSNFLRWIAARQAIAAELPENQRKSYENLTSDIQCRYIGKLPSLTPFVGLKPLAP